MPRLLVCLAAALTVGASTVLANEASRITPDEGAWSAGYRDGGIGKLTIQFTSIDGVGELILESGNWLQGSSTVRCQYVFDIDAGVVEQAYINTGYDRSSSFCPPDMPFTTVRTGPDTLKLTPHPAVVPQLRLEEIDLYAGVRPLRDEERLTPVERLDILGLKIGQTREEAEQILIGAGFTLQPNPATMTSEGYVSTTELWERNADSSNKSGDGIIINWTAKVDWLESEERIMALSRDWKIPQSSGMAQATLIDALSTKYNIDLSTNSASVTYTRTGDISDRGRCGDGSLQNLNLQGGRGLQSEARGGIGIFSKQMSMYCGQFISISTRPDRNTGMADTLRIDIADTDMVWDDFWLLWAHNKNKEYSTLLDTLRGATGAAPEL